MRFTACTLRSTLVTILVAGCASSPHAAPTPRAPRAQEPELPAAADPYALLQAGDFSTCAPRSALDALGRQCSGLESGSVAQARAQDALMHLLEELRARPRESSADDEAQAAAIERASLRVWCADPVSANGLDALGRISTVYESRERHDVSSSLMVDALESFDSHPGREEAHAELFVGVASELWPVGESDAVVALPARCEVRLRRLVAEQRVGFCQRGPPPAPILPAQRHRLCHKILEVRCHLWRLDAVRLADTGLHAAASDAYADLLFGQHRRCGAFPYAWGSYFGAARAEAREAGDSARLEALNEAARRARAALPPRTITAAPPHSHRPSLPGR